MERYIERRRRAFLPEVQRLAAEADITESALLFLMYTRQLDTDGRVPLARLRRRAVYATKEGWRARLEPALAAGMLESDEAGWHLTSRGRAQVEQAWLASRAHQRSLPLPAAPLRRAVAALEAIVRDAPARDDERLASVRRTAPPDRDSEHLAVRVEQAMFETAVLHDDGHIGAWERAGYAGPVLDVLTRVWQGRDTHAALVEALASTQERADVDRGIAELVRRGDLVREGDAVRLTEQGRARRDAIEAETDRVGFARWPRGEALEGLIADVDALAAALPPEDALPVGPTH